MGARAEMKKEMLYAVRTAATVAAQDLKLAVRDGEKKMIAFQKKASNTHAASGIARKALKEEVAANAKEISRMIKDAVSTDARAQSALQSETAKSIKKTNTQVDAYANQMKKIAESTRTQIKKTTSTTLTAIAAEEKRAKAKKQLAADRKHADDALAGAVKGLNDNLAKQAALADSRFEKTVKDISKARAEAATAV